MLVTGGAGFIGSHLCKFLLEKGEKVVCLDNFFTGKTRNIEELKEKFNFKIISHDITDTKVPLDIKILEKIDKIYKKVTSHP